MQNNPTKRRTLKILQGETKKQILQEKLEIAVKNERYEQAEEIKQQIQKISGN